MDTSKEYIKMCDCPEIQDKRRGLFDEHSIILCSCGRSWIADIHSKDEIQDSKNHHIIWLPRQDQLQAMVMFGLVLWQLVFKFNLWVTAHYKNYTVISMEQLWFAFVMWELYQKRWDGNEWIKEEDTDETT